MSGAGNTVAADNVEESYPLSPTQQGLSFERLVSPDYPRSQCLPEPFEAQVERTPNAVALVYGKEEVSYRELDNQADRAALHLRSLGVSPEVPIRIDAKKAGLPAELAKAMERWNTPAISWTHAPPDAHFARTISCKPSLLQYGCGNGKAQPRL